VAAVSVHCDCGTDETASELETMFFNVALRDIDVIMRVTCLA